MVHLKYRRLKNLFHERCLRLWQTRTADIAFRPPLPYPSSDSCSCLLYTPHITTRFLLPYAYTYLGPSQRLPAGRQAASHSELCCFLLVGLTTTMTTAAGEGRHARRSSSAKAAAAKAAWVVMGPASFPACVVGVKMEEMSMCSG